MANTGGSQNTQNFPIVSAPGKVPVVNSIFDFSADALAQLRLWLEQNPPAIGITNILGFTQFTAQVATTITTGESTTSATFTDLATVGPTLSSLPDGKYLLLFGHSGFVDTSGVAAAMALQVNAVAAVNSDAAKSPFVNVGSSVMRVVAKDLSNGGNNTVTAKYRVESGSGAQTGTFSNRWLIALRYAN